MNWWILLVCDLIIPITMLVFGIIMKKKAPSNINYVFGYRTTRSMKNQDTWKFAHEHCGRLWRKIGIGMLIVTAVSHIPFYNSNETTLGRFATIVSVTQVLLLLISIIPTELALKKTFNDDGIRK